MSKIFITIFQSIFRHFRASSDICFLVQGDRLLLSTSEMTGEASGKWDKHLFQITHKVTKTHKHAHCDRQAWVASHVVSLSHF